MDKIRPYLPDDLGSLCEICLLTGNNGRDGTATFSDRTLVANYFAAPYAAYDSSQCLILADELGPAGYIVGVADTRAYLRWFNTEWLPPLRETYRDRSPRPGASDGWLFDLVRQDAIPPAWVDDYPAHLHIDLLPRAQGRGLGRQLFERWTRQIAASGGGGIHLGVAKANQEAIGFYERMGMRRFQDRDGAWMYVLPLGPHPSK